MARRHVTKKEAKDVAEERMERLFELAAGEATKGMDSRAKRYVQLALKIGERYKVPRRHRREYCPDCHSYFVPPRNVRVRTGDKRVVITCLSCGRITRYPTRLR